MRQIHPSRIIEILGQLDSKQKKMTVEQLLKNAEEGYTKQKDEEVIFYETLWREFNDSYIKVKDTDGAFGPESNYYYIKDLKPGSLTTEYKRLFNITGRIICFSDMTLYSRDMDLQSLKNSVSAEYLRSAEKISEEEFYEAQEEFEKIQTIIIKMRD